MNELVQVHNLDCSGREMSKTIREQQSYWIANISSQIGGTIKCFPTGTATWLRMDATVQADTPRSDYGLASQASTISAGGKCGGILAWVCALNPEFDDIGRVRGRAADAMVLQRVSSHAMWLHACQWFRFVGKRVENLPKSNDWERMHSAYFWNFHAQRNWIAALLSRWVRQYLCRHTRACGCLCDSASAPSYTGCSSSNETTIMCQHHALDLAESRRSTYALFMGKRVENLR